jgi:hypothetical protein
MMLCSRNASLPHKICRHVTPRAHILRECPTSVSNAPNQHVVSIRNMSIKSRLSEAMSPSRLKEVIKEYGKVAAIFHTSVFCTTLGISYSCIQFGMNIREAKIPFVDMSKIDPNAGTFLLSYLATVATGIRRLLSNSCFRTKVIRACSRVCYDCVGTVDCAFTENQIKIKRKMK